MNSWLLRKERSFWIFIANDFRFKGATLSIRSRKSLALIIKLKGSEGALEDATKVLKVGSREAKMASSSLEEIRNVIKSVSNYGKK